MQDTYVISDSLVATLKSFLKVEINFNDIFTNISTIFIL